MGERECRDFFNKLRGKELRFRAICGAGLGTWGQSVTVARLQGAGVGTAGWLQAGLRSKEFSCTDKTRRTIWQGHCWQEPVLRLPCNCCHLVQHEPPCVCPAQHIQHLPNFLPAPLHPQQGGCTALHSGQFQSPMCTPEGMQLVSRGSCFRRALLAACPALPSIFAANRRKFGLAWSWH